MEQFTSRFFASSGAYAPSLLGAILTLAIGVLAAYLLAALTRRLAARSQFDEKLARLVRGPHAAEGVDTARWAGRAVFWLVMLVALLAFFNVLGFTPITAPLSNAFALALAFLPRLLAAAALVLLAWIVASALRVVVRRVIDAARLDERLLKRRTTYEGTVMPPPAIEPANTARISRALGQAAYFLTWLFFLPAILGALALEGILGPVQTMVNKILGFLPNIATAALIVIAAVFVGRIVGGLVTSLLAAGGLDRFATRVGVGVGRPVGETGLTVPRFVPSQVLGKATAVVIVLFATMEAFDVIAFEQLSAMTGDLLQLLARVAIGLVIFAAGWALATAADRAIRSSSIASASFFASAARVAILVLAGAMALRHMGFANEIIQIGFALLMGGIAAAVAIAFGVGGRQVAGRELERWVDRARRREPELDTAAPAH